MIPLERFEQLNRNLLLDRKRALALYAKLDMYRRNLSKTSPLIPQVEQQMKELTYTIGKIDKHFKKLQEDKVTMFGLLD